MLNSPLGQKLLAILFAANDPVTVPQLREVFPDRDPAELRQGLEALSEAFNKLQDSVEIRPVAGGYRLTTRPEHHEAIRAYLKTRASAKLSMAALETLAVIAYKQPVTLPEVAEIRGLKGTTTVKTLLEKRLVETRGRKKTVGRPMQYGTTREFLVHFGLNDIHELPTVKELEEILNEAGEA